MLDVSKSFRENKVLKNINWEIKKGEKVGIIGLVGSGKTILLDQLIRVFDPDEGEILVNGMDIKEYDLGSLRSRFGFCFQENFLVEGSIKENIIFGRNIPQKDLKKAIETSDVLRIIKEKEGGVNSQVGEKGSNLSGGQKQRIMLARALAGNPDVLVLDNATSRLDIKTEGIISKSLKINYPDLTTIIVAQKISSMKDCDRIYVIDEGEIESVGKHRDLLSSSPIYKEIELTQSNYKG